MRTLLLPLLLASLLAPVPAHAQEASSSGSPRPPCGAPPYQSISVDPATAAPSDPVTVTVLVRDEPCYPDESRAHAVELYAAREPGDEPVLLVSGSTDRSGRLVHVEQATSTTTFWFRTLDSVRRYGSSSARLTVDRTSGSCAGALTLRVPSSVPVGARVQVRGTTSDTSTVSIAFRKRGQSSFSVRRRLTPVDGSFATSFLADDDYRLVASNDRCDSLPVLVTAAPVISGPAVVRRGSVVTLTVRATPGMPLAVAFRRAGQTGFTLRRWGTAGSSGTFTTTYRADVGHQYYAVERQGQRSAPRTTHVR